MAPKACTRKIKKSEFLKPRISNDRICNKEWLKYITDHETSKAAIPVGPCFQVDVPDWSGQIPKNYPDESKWFGANAWQTKYATPSTVEEDSNTIGKGRHDSCSCTFSGSPECVKLHVRDKSNQLMSDLGPAYQKWRFHKISDAVGNSWKLNE